MHPLFLAIQLGIIVLVLLLVLVIVLVSRYADQKRLQAYQAFCASSGYQLVPQRNGAEREYVQIVPFFDRGYARRWRREISGQYNGIAFTAFQFDYTVSTGRSSATYQHAMIRWSVDRSLPAFTLGPETFFTRIGEALGFHDINFDDDQVFSHEYRLKGDDVVAVSAYFSPAIRQQLDALPGQHAAGAGPVLFWWRDGALPAPEGFPQFLAAGDQVRAILTGG